MSDKEKLVELLGNIYLPMMCGPDTIGEYRIPHKFKKEIASHLIARGVTVQEWISVDERLPENDVMVIGYTPCDGFMFVGYYHEEPKYDWKVWRIVTAMRSTKVMKKKVTHWLPFPKPPKGE